MASKDKNKKNIPQQIPAVEKKTNVQVAENSNSKWAEYALAIVLAITFVIYFKAIRFNLLMWDDDLYINLNDDIKSLANIKLFFTDFYAGNYQPITMLIYAIEYQLGGNSGTLYHFNNILLHLLNTYLVFVLIQKISPQNISVALITAAFFAVHPMHVESVAWVAERKDVLYSFFFLLALIFYTNYLKTENIKLFLLTSVFFVLSCLSKSAAVVLPLVLLLIDYYTDRKYNWKIIIEKLPLLTLSIIFGLMAMASQKEAMLDIQETSFVERLAIVSNSYITYLTKAFFPVNLSAFYPYPMEIGATLPVVYYLSILLVGLVLFFVWYAKKWGKEVVFGIGFFTITILLVLQIIPVGNATMAERYTYIPYIGIFFMIGKWYEYLSYNNIVTYKNYLSIVCLVGFIIFSLGSFARVAKWENDEILFTDAIEKYPSAPLLYNNRGCFYLKIGQDDAFKNSPEKELIFKKSLQDFNKIIELNPNYFHAYYNRGMARYFLGDYSNAIKDFDKEIAKNDKDKEAYFDRANAKKALKDFGGAIKDLDKVIELNPSVATLYFNRGNVKREMNDLTGAIQDLDKAIELNPQMLDAYNNRSLLKCVLKDYAGTIADYDKMIELNPQDTATIRNKKIIQALLEAEGGEK